jgi:hypothetical protein
MYMAEYHRGLAERHQQLLIEARASFRAMDGWAMVKSQEQWQETVRKAAEDLEKGTFLLERLGAERHLDPQLMAVLLVLRRRLIDEHGAVASSSSSASSPTQQRERSRASSCQSSSGELSPGPLESSASSSSATSSSELGSRPSKNSSLR